MTKRLHMSAPSSEPPKQKGSGSLWFVLALLLACAIGVGFAFAASLGKSSLGQFSLRFSQAGRQSAPEMPRVLPSMRLGGWPAGLIAQAEGTKLKSPPPAAPMVALAAIAIVIDDCGVDISRTRTAMALPAAMTLAFLPYPRASALLSHEAHMAGHEIIVHLPMGPGGAEKPGPMPLAGGVSAGQNQPAPDLGLGR